MWRLVLALTSVATLASGGGELRKCCPLSEILNGSVACVPYNSTDVTAFGNDSKRWIPESEIDVDNATLQAVLLNTTIKIGAKPACGKMDMDMLVGSGREHYRIFIDDAGNFKLNASKDASLLDLEEFNQWDRPSLDSSDFCMDQMELAGSLMWVAVVCPCRVLPCVKKCCHEGHGFDIPTHSCVRLEEDQQYRYGYWSPKLKVPAPSSHFYRLAASVPDCPGKVFMETTNGSDNKHFLLLDNGSLQLSTQEPPIPTAMFCGDYTTAGGSSEVVFACRLPEEERSELVYLLYGAGLILSAAVLLATVLVQWMIHATNSLHGRLGFTHNCCLVLGFLLLSAIQLGPNRPVRDMCLTLAFIIQFSFLAAFFWLNVMCIDISWAFSGFRPPQGSVSERDRKKFIYYSLYAWGSPTIILIVTAVMEFVESIPDTYLKPNFGVKACWFKEKSASFAYFYGPMAALLLVNFILFIYTTVKIIQVQRDTRILHNGESGRHDGSNFKKDKKRLILYAKLFCLMGLTWITEIISVLYQDSPHYYWYVTDAINLLRAVFIFIIFCCKRKVFRLLKQRLFPSFGAENNASQSNGTRKSSSSTQNSILPPIPMNQLNRNGKVADKTTPENR
ncbi:G-protein coupled receptor Mth2 isoform X3 [Anabrus simplex]|uniref:G-protein coupled receptor Mth2 isoform X3 n=1 Tax=Anabrus simplex TaxID=316456 RepID=UPI0034DD9202